MSSSTTTDPVDPPATTLAPIAERAAAPSVLPAVTAGGLEWRPATSADAPALLALKNQIADADHEPYRETLAEVQDLFTGAWRDVERDSLVGVDADGSLRAWAFVDTMPGDVTTVRTYLWGGVHPSHRGRGIGRELLSWEIARGRQLLAASGKEVPARIALYTEDTDPPSKIRLFERSGFEARRFYADLRRDLATPVPDVTLDGSLRVVPWSEELDEATRLAHNDAFRDHWGSEPRSPESWTHGRSEFAPQWSFLVVDDAPVDAPHDGPLVVGYQLASRYDEDFPVRGYTFGYTEVLGVRRAYRGRKIAVAALAAGMRAFAADGMQAAVLAVDTANPSGAHGLYASLGYEKESGSTLYSIEL